MCKPYGLLASYNCDRVMLYLLHCSIAQILIAFPLGNYFHQLASAENQEHLNAQREINKIQEMEEMKDLTTHEIIDQSQTAPKNLRKTSNISDWDDRFSLAMCSEDLETPRGEPADNPKDLTLKEVSLWQKVKRKFWGLIELLDNRLTKAILAGAVLAFIPGTKYYLFDTESYLGFIQRGLYNFGSIVG
jgi:hypothetical protein